VLLGNGSLNEKIQSGEIVVEGDNGKLDEFVSMLDNFDFWFNIVTP
jgi:alkyl sulfatase BDS1-like metallo-beta-lactamase superfamily hydrolase